MRRIRRWPSVVLLLLAVCSATLVLAAYRDEAVKAAFLYRFTGYVDWPPATLRTGQFNVSVLGAPEVALELSRLFLKYPVKNLPARVRSIESPDQALDSHMLYVGPEYAGSVPDVVATVGQRPILIVTDHPTGLDDGSAVNFMLVDRRVRFEVSLAATNKAGLKVSSQLLSVAAHVRGAALPRPEDSCLGVDPAAPEVPLRCGLRMVLMP